MLDTKVAPVGAKKDVRASQAKVELRRRDHNGTCEGLPG